MIKLKSPREIENMRRAGRRLAQGFLAIDEMIKPGIKTRELDEKIEEQLRLSGGKPAFKGYTGGGKKAFPFTTCISINEEVVHGMPSDRMLEEGQIVGIDAGLQLNGWFSDMACSFIVGSVDEKTRLLWKTTRDALYKGIEQARSGNRLIDIGGAIQDCAENYGFSVVRDLVGHGIGSNLHEDPAVPNYRSRHGDMKLRAGMTIAIEPMLCVGDWRIKVLKDGWTAATVDRSFSGHFEHTILITDGEPEILTLLEDGSDPWFKLNSLQE